LSERCYHVYQASMVKIHNDLRQKHHVQPLKSDARLEEIAQNMAHFYASLDRQLINQKNEIQDLEHSKPEGLGQNAALFKNTCSSFSNCLRALKAFLFLLFLIFSSV
jgi:hypothetical protein